MVALGALQLHLASIQGQGFSKSPEFVRAAVSAPGAKGPASIGASSYL
jgi:hypothetical protein